MVYGIAGNTQKPTLWQPLAQFVRKLVAERIDFVMPTDLALGLAQLEGLSDLPAQAIVDDLAAHADLIFSFGGDGTLLNTAHEIGRRETPILGVNLGRLGFLANVEVGHLDEALAYLQKRDYRVEKRMVLEVTTDHEQPLAAPWALNEIALQRSGTTGLLSLDVSVDGIPLNTYWADGLLIAPPTGSTAYSLAAGGPIIMPGSAAILLTPLASHTLTIRPIVLPDAATIVIHVRHDEHNYVIGVDGKNTVFHQERIQITIRKAAHAVHLVQLPHHHFFQALRSKLMWGVRKSNG